MANIRHSILGLLCAMALAIGACRASAPSAVETISRDDAAEAAIRLAELADAERLQNSAPRRAALPPGVQPTLLAHADPTDPGARVSLDEMLRDMSARDFAIVENGRDSPATSLDPNQSIEAHMHYVRGRQAALDNRPFVAVQEFEQALRLDPGSAAIQRQLARAYASTGNTRRAVEMYQQVLAQSRDDSEACFAIGAEFMRQGRFQEGIELFARVRARGEGFQHDPAANLLADRYIAAGAQQLGYARAEAEALERMLAALDQFDEPTAFANEVGWMRSRRGEFLRALGDAQCRLEEFDAALRSYAVAGGAENADDRSLLPRVLYANLRLGRIWNAQLALLDALRNSGMQFDPGLIDLAGYLREETGDTQLLARAIHDASPSAEPGVEMTRAAAALVPVEEAIPLLRELIAGDPHDTSALRQFLRALDADDPTRGTSILVDLTEDHPDAAAEFAGQMMEEYGFSPDVIRSVQADECAAARLLESHLFLAAGAPAEAWRAAGNGLEQNARSDWLHAVHVTAAGALGEAALVDRAAAEAPQTPAVLDAIAGAEEAVERIDRALAAARKSIELDPNRPLSLVLLARLLAHNAPTAGEAAAAAERALAVDPQLDAAYEILITIHQADGPLPDQRRLQGIISRLQAAAPQGRLFGLLAADERFAQGSLAQAIDILTALHERFSGDAEILRRLTQVWLQAGESSTARHWLEEQLQNRPHHPHLVQARVGVLLSEQRFLEAEDALRARIDAWESDPLAPALLEIVLQAQGRQNEAWALAEERLMARPEAPRRQIELAALHTAKGEVEQARSMLEPLLDSLDDLTRADAMRLLAVTTAWRAPLSADTTSFQRRAALEVVRHHPDAPLAAYVAAITATMHADDSNANVVGDLIDQAIERAESGTPVQEAQQYRAAAQQLLDAGFAGAAADLLSRRVVHRRTLSSEGHTLIVQVAQASLVRAGRIDDLIALLEHLDGQGELSAIYPRAESPQLEALHALSTLATLLGQDGDADQLLTHARGIDPGHAMTLNNLGYHRVEIGRADADTAAIVERAHELEPDDPNILDTLAWLRYKQGRFGDDSGSTGDGALNLIERSIERTERDGQPISAEVHDHRGDTLWQLKRVDEAITSWRSAIAAIEEPAFRQETMQGFERFQLNTWGVRLLAPDEVFDLAYADILEGARYKIAAAELGADPPIAPTFDEIAASGGR